MRWLVLGVLLFPLFANAQGEGPEAAALRLAVAPFEGAGPAARVAPDIAVAVGEALSARGVGLVVPPAQLRLAGGADSEAAVEAARRAGAAAVVVGRVTQLGNRLSVDVRLRSASSGGVLGTYVAEIPLGDPLGPAADSLAERIVLGALTLVDMEGPAGEFPVAGSPAPTAGRFGASSQAAAKPPFAMGDLAGESLSIVADELEATERGQMRTLVFKRAVKVEQADLGLTARELVADYVAGEKQPHRLVATGDVSLTQGKRSASCDRAVYEGDRIVCTGNGHLQDGEDQIEGDEITFDLARSGVVVEGGTTLRLNPAGSSLVGEGMRVVGHPADAPMTIRADRLEAQEAPEPALNRIVLEGGVEVEQSGVTLRSDRLEILYPKETEHPERMEATGHVTLAHGEREARCDRAIYRAAPHRIECVGGDLLDTGDAVAGEVISFDLDEDRVTVHGGARLRLSQRKPSAEGATP
jgi:lipopolysaccharide transport protein LptA